ncbi:uracil-DNA glycosylase [Sulfobacillus thermosulfidooxidans]|uniref:Type-4 uracil-DNA glycosylase n=2 Tax=Sulfobacillus thermosulfidooxidans TaxID=28034 RepID=A0A1W1WK46_SULTA|nr:uracil-DNA glycosylase [Sulfobacillus thermosulfidooxidans]OLZ12184.1 uracil-DNA glycosylase [Sulfobacillus thermosulfidooxidans]OLZ13036.1 uracil-DNA glycosylase [Sulfobacillus thermosulfidooxidans]OLZ21416.1 uracil-DNA glycosylase [Sulfobacillus thermosulfidooxidans]PSR27486.1 MAG: uracil-DNA glycosylase [Sulfobacillus thermosulfidooxidans]SMC06390.1 DNA polymerase [Sulfobacillus thermosulfidooxidans DSM 9293]
MADEWTEDEEFRRLREKILQCHRCDLRTAAHGVVFGEGDSHHPPLVFIGEGPGAEEDRLLRPFVGPAGQLLDKMLQAGGFDRFHGVYILNVVKCRPPHNRTPTREERLACWPNLSAQLRYLSPRIVVLLGSTAVQTLLGIASLSAARGRWFERGGVFFRATFHPAALLRNPKWKVLAWEDMKVIIDKYRECINPEHYSPFYPLPGE